MKIDACSIGKNIRTARNEKNMTQRELSEKAELSQTQLSDYETGNKMPGLISLAKIALVLDKSIDELYFGDSSESFITTAPNKGRLISNCIYQLWINGAISSHKDYDEREYSHCYPLPIADLGYYSNTVTRLLKDLDEFKSRKENLSNPELFLEQILDSAANEINKATN